ncbi:LysR family transcriptional regulator [Streptomyces sp. LP05-1]|uniref:LysR family transcriptional regulator n=1 Tax=Streptomyces pyxinae TaxID=2970734 RepID=A0ABT2CD96_9ACTN|nr:LysR family transcriptional regulator [Streptomyces sp. LP05-1]MCS0634594.1 LysR family transcriptional regulator [Streptomyces sp. LP05-1]
MAVTGPETTGTAGTVRTTTGTTAGTTAGITRTAAGTPRTTGGEHTPAGTVEIRELECFLVLAEELHFGRTGQRLYVSQGRVSQLIRALEQRIGARLVDRTSRRVQLTPLGADFLGALRPAYTALRATVENARAAALGVSGPLRIGFQGVFGYGFMDVVGEFEERYPECATRITELPLSDPFGPLHRDEVDTAVVLLPVEEPALVLGPVFSRQPQYLAVSRRHPFAGRPVVDAEELAGSPLVGVAAPAPEYWREVQAPTRTPSGAPVPPGPAVGTLQEGLSLVAANRGVMLLCHPTTEYHHRRDVAYVPVTGLPESALGLVWRADRENARVRAFAEAVAGALD